MLTELIEKRIIAFVNTVANDCCTCLRRDDINCRHCRSAWANSIMRDIEASGMKPQTEHDCSFVARVARILLILKTAGKPLLCKEIDMSAYCNGSLKEFTLREMVHRGMIVREKPDGEEIFYLYSLPHTKERTLENGNTKAK